MKKQLAFVKIYIKMLSSFWENIVWNDESKFVLRQKRNQVWRKRNEACKKQFIRLTVKFDGGALMVWGCFSHSIELIRWYKSIKL